jgi:hypothetical protein
MAAHVVSSQLYSMGHKRRPVSSCSKPQSSLDVGERGADRGAPSMLEIQLTTAGFKLAASSPLAPPDSFPSCLKLSTYLALNGTGTHIAKIVA